MFKDLLVMGVKWLAGNVGTDLDMSKDINNANRSLFQFNGNIASLVNSIIVEPLIITTADARKSPAYQNMLSAELDIFCGYYLTAFKIMTDKYGVDANFAIDILSTQYNAKNVVRNKTVGTIVDAITRNSACDTWELMSNKSLSNYISKERDTSRTILNGNKSQQEDLKYEIDANKPTNDGMSFVVRELSVTIETKTVVKNENGGKTVIKCVKFPIIIRAAIKEVSLDNLLAVIAPNSKDNSFRSRYHEWRSGGITLSDFLFCGDLTKAYKKNKIKDTENVLDVVNNRNINASAKAAIFGNKGFEGNYNMLIISSTDIPKLNLAIKGNVYKPKFADDLLDMSSSILFSILDDDYERATLFIKDAMSDSKIPYKRLEKNKKEGSNYDDLMKAIMLGKQLQF